MALLEVLAALTILGLVMLPMMELFSGAASAWSRAVERERRIADEERLLSAHALLSSNDLDRRIGARDIGPYVLTITRPEPELYRVSVGTTGVLREDLVTVVRRETSRVR